ncbi:MAG TPA: LysR family transcriptional regulator [Ramlibacter sp.]|nr:LysR family transcriptional regulator [Ramlibacter sp.]
MRFNKLDMNLLVALDALLHELSISRAAERMNMSQSAMSSALGRLRDYFDDELLVQVGRKMELTPRAEVLRDAVHDVLLRVDATVAARPEFDPAQSDREFRILASDYTMATLMPHALALAHRQSARARFMLLPQVEDPQRALERGEVDLLIMPRDYCAPDHPTEVLFTEEFVCVLWQGSALAQGELTFERYAAAGHVVMQPHGTSQPSFEGWFVQRYGLARRVEVTSYNFVSPPQLVVGTERIATVHARLAHQLSRALPVVLRKPPFAMPAMQQALQWHKYRTKDPGIVWLRQVLHDAAQEMDRPQSEPTTAPGG